MIELGEFSNVVQVHDEFNTLVDSLGLYKSGGSSGSSYDRSLFNSLYNGDEEITRTTIKCRVKAKKPRLSIISAGHTYKIMEMLKKEKKSSSCSDGFISRFIFCAPQTIRCCLKSVPEYDNKCFDVKHLLNATYIINKDFQRIDKSEYLTFEEDAFNLLNVTFEHYDRISTKYQLKDGFIR